MNEGIVPKIYLCGDKTKFFAWIGQRPFKLAGVLKFFGDDLDFREDGKFLLDDKICERDEIKNILADADFIVFRDARELKLVYTSLKKSDIDPSKLVTRVYFKNLPTDNFYDVESDLKIMQFMKVPPIKTLLDFDAYFLKSPLVTKLSNDVTEIDCITQEVFPPIKENIYSHVYKNLGECCLKHYDAALIYATSQKKFLADYAKLKNIADILITYVRNDSEMQKYIKANINFFSKIDILPTVLGQWLFCYYHQPKKDFAIYVVTHKKMPDELVNNLPEGYKIIHAGKAVAADLGYMGDDTGENVSHLNPYMNELTAFYWVWKNTNHTIVGTAHYRRYLTAAEGSDAFSYDKILTEEQAENFLNRYDVLATMFYGVVSEVEEIVLDYNEDSTALAVAIIEKYMAEVQPDYVETFQKVMNNSHFYRYNIIVTRKNVFDAYYSWLFSFFQKAVDEINLRIDFGDKKPRMAGFLGERMFTVWVMKNRLRVKELVVMQVPDL